MITAPDIPNVVFEKLISKTTRFIEPVVGLELYKGTAITEEQLQRKLMTVVAPIGLGSDDIVALLRQRL